LHICTYLLFGCIGLPCLDEFADYPMVAAASWTPLFCVLKGKSKTGRGEEAYRRGVGLASGGPCLGSALGAHPP